MRRDDAILRETRWLCWVVVAVLLPAVVVLWGFPGNTEDFWSWPIAADLSQIFMGAGYGAGAYFFTRAALASRWHTVSAGVLSAAFFAAVICSSSRSSTGTASTTATRRSGPPSRSTPG